MKTCLLVSICLLSYLLSRTQQVTVLTSGQQTSLRGLSVVSNKIAWASGSNGTVARTTDGGNTWSWIHPEGYEQRDFRDIEGFDDKTAVVMAIAEPAILLKTTDAGRHWKKVYENTTPGMFLDAMTFWNRESGMVIGDPVNGKFFIARTYNNGETWENTSPGKLPAADSGEACFASSGSNIAALNLAEAGFISGGTRARFFYKGRPVTLPLQQGNSSSGANSLAARDPKKRKNKGVMVVVGGDFAHDTVSSRTCALSADGGKTWTLPEAGPHGYRSCVIYLDKHTLFSCGTSGTDWSTDGGQHWQQTGTEGFHVCAKAKHGNAVFLAGNGKIASFSRK